MQYASIFVALVSVQVSAQSGFESFRRQLEIFANGKGQYIVEAGHFDKAGRYLGDDKFFCEGRVCHQMKETKFAVRAYMDRQGRHHSKYWVRIEDPRMSGQKEDSLFRSDNHMISICGDRMSNYKKLVGEAVATVRMQVQLNALPTVLQIEFLARVPSTGEVLVAFGSKYHNAYASMKMYAGQPGALKQVKIQKVDSYRDGGTTYVYTEAGTLFSPSPVHRELNSTWTPKYGEEVEVEMTSHPSADDLRKLISDDLANQMKPPPLRTFCDLPVEASEK